MRPLDESFSSTVRGNKSRPSSTSSRSPSPGLRGGGSSSGGLGTAGGSHAGGMTYFLTEENNFGVHSMSESHLSSSVRTSPPPEVIERPITSSSTTATMGTGAQDTAAAQETTRGNPSRKDDEAIASAIPQHLFERGGHSHTPSVGSLLSPDISTPSSPQHNLSSSAISDDSDLELSSHHEEEFVAPSDSITSSFPQLVMPKVNMPRRKPFTEAGRTMGKLKIMVVGDSGIGKSNLIQAILHTSPDIVHYDPPQIATSSTSSSSSFIKPSLSRRGTLQPNTIPPTDNILEIKASTRAYPPWWKTETDRDIKANRPIISRRESTGEVLERNICFVDTPGYGSSDDFNDVLARVSGYIEECYDKINSLLNSSAHRTNDLLSLFSNGVNGVDLVIYVVLHRLKPVDITIMRHLSTLTNILPVIAKSDSLSHTQTLTLKLSLLRDLRANNIPIFTFGKSLSELERNVVNGIPWAVSCLRDDASEMDASLLMRDDPLIESTMYVDSDLPHLVQMLSTHAGWLRFSATRKFLDWRNTAQGHDIDPQPAMSIVALPRDADGGGYAMARVGDHIDREERLARVRLVQWASDMRKTVHKRMQEEREQYERIEAQERIKWLVERLNEAISLPETALVPITSNTTSTTTTTASSMTRRRGSGSRSLSTKKRWRRVETDPLGLVWVKESWGPRVTKSIVWIVEAGVVLGSGWVVWKYVLDSGLTGWFMQHSGRST